MQEIEKERKKERKGETTRTHTYRYMTLAQISSNWDCRTVQTAVNFSARGVAVISTRGVVSVGFDDLAAPARRDNSSTACDKEKHAIGFPR